MKVFPDASASNGYLAYAFSGEHDGMVRAHVAFNTKVGINVLQELSKSSGASFEIDGDERQVLFHGQLSHKKLVAMSAESSRLGYPLIRVKLDIDDFNKIHPLQ